MQPAFMIDNEITCENCDAVFTISKKQGVKVKKLGPIEDHEQRISQLETKVESLIPGEEPKTEEQPREDDEDDSIL